MNNSAIDKHKISMLCLGDSYTIGEAVETEKRFCNQAIEILKNYELYFNEPEIIAQTGWTTDELASAIQEKKITKKFDIVTLLIGVNNQYRNRSIENFKEEFSSLLQSAISFSAKGKESVILLSIPDWSVTPFIAQDAQKRTAHEVSTQITQFNQVIKETAKELNVAFVDITPISQRAKAERNLIAQDGLHPSGEMYALWAKDLAAAIAPKINGIHNEF